MRNEQQKLLCQLEKLNKEISKLPDGNLIYSRSGNHTKWYKSNGSNPIYIPKSSYHIAQALALKKYYMLRAEEISYQLKQLNRFLKSCQKCTIKSSKLLEDSSCYKELLSYYFQKFPSKLEQWLNAEYNQNTNFSEYLIHKTLAGHNVRSKSEVIIANSLFINKIPYRYECELVLDEIHLYPDFTILHPKNYTILYWEHFGLMGNKIYQEKTFNKLKIYARNNIIPSINLIATYETIDHPIDSDKIHKLIQEYFL